MSKETEDFDKELLETLNEGIISCEGEPNEASWTKQYGVLISISQAEYFLKLINENQNVE